MRQLGSTTFPAMTAAQCRAAHRRAMPRRCSTDPRLPDLIAGQDRLITRGQAIDHGLTARVIAYRLAEHIWQLVLPGVYVTTSGEVTRRQRLVAALLYAGPQSAVDAA